MMITIKSVVPIRVSIAEDQSVVAVPSLTIPPPVLFRTKQMSNISYSRHRQNLDIFSPCFILYHQIKLLDYYSDLRETGRVEKTKVGRFMSGGRPGPGGKGWH